MATGAPRGPTRRFGEYYFLTSSSATACCEIDLALRRRVPPSGRILLQAITSDLDLLAWKCWKGGNRINSQESARSSGGQGDGGYMMLLAVRPESAGFDARVPQRETVHVGSSDCAGKAIAALGKASDSP